MNESAELFTIGQLARRTGLAARTIRFWSDAGLISPARRSASGYRLYDAAAVTRVDLVRTLRELGLSLEVVQAVLSRARTVAEVAAAHVAALDAEIRTLRLRRAVLSAIAQHGSTTEETLLMHKLAKLSAQARQQIIDDFVQSVFEGVDPGSPGTSIGLAMRQLPADLPDDPAPEQVSAWIELGELVADESFRQRVRTMALAGAQAGGAGADGADGAAAVGAAYPAVLEHAGPALAQGIDPGSDEGRAILDRIVAPATPVAERARLLEQLETFTDARVERYWQLLAIINGREQFPATVPAFQWLISALRATVLSRLSRVPAYHACAIPSGEHCSRSARHPRRG